MTRTLLDSDRGREAQRQRRLLLVAERRFAREFAAPIATAMRQMVAEYERTGSTPSMPMDHLRRVEAVYLDMAGVVIEAFGDRILGQGKSMGLQLERKGIWADFFQRLALDWISSEAIRRRITSITDTTRNTIVERILRGQRDGLGVDAIAKAITEAIPQISRQRGALIARTETHGAANFGANEAARATGLQLEKEWNATEDIRTRTFSDGDEYDHRAMDGQRVGMDDPFRMPWIGGGDVLCMFPGDPELPAAAAINCLPPWSKVRLAGIKRVMMCEYSGDLFKFSFAGPVDFTVTANHPVLTLSGWKPARLVKKGDKLIYGGIGRAVPIGVNANVENGHARIDQLYDALKPLGGLVWASSDAVDFHGDMPNGDVDIVTVHGKLRDRVKSEGRSLFGEIALADTHVSKGLLLARRMVGLRDGVSADLSDGRVSGFGSRGALLGGGFGGLPPVALADVWSLNPHIRKAAIDHGAGQVELLGDAVNGMAISEQSADMGVVALPDNAPPFVGAPFEAVEVTSVHSFHYEGPVYNCETDTGLIVSDGIVNHNCRCVVTHVVLGLDD